MNIKEMNKTLKETRAAMNKIFRNQGNGSAEFGPIEIDALDPDDLYQAQLVLISLKEHARMISAACGELGEAFRVTGDTEEEVNLPGRIIYARSIGDLLEPVERQVDAVQKALSDVYGKIGYLRREL